VLVRLLGVEPGTDIAASALCEIGNVLVSSYVGALASMTGLALEPRPPLIVEDMLAAVLASVLLESGEGNVVLQLESVLAVDGDSCPLAFLFIPTPEGVVEMLSRLGLS
jgi:chemotaxis protein CheC